MNAAGPTYDLTEVAQFLQFWLTVTGMAHVTLTSIAPLAPDEPTATVSFQRGDGQRMGEWIATAQNAGRNIYFQPNETLPGCAKKPTKLEMMAAVCRFADIDPVDDLPLGEERDRLGRLADHLAASPICPPTCVIDSGNGVQPVWASEREVLSKQIIARIEAETKAIEAALGAGGTHNIDRLLRLPGTINYPNGKKLAQGRGIARARLIHSADNTYTAAQAAALAGDLTTSLRDTGLVRPRPTRPAGASASGDDSATADLIAKLKDANADEISKPEHLSAELLTRLDAATKARKRLADRWAGMVDDLTEAGRDSSRSAIDLSLAAMLKAARFSHLETGLILCAYPHGKAVGDDWTAGGRLRYVARCVLRSHKPKPQSADDDAIQWATPLDFIADQETPPPQLRQEYLPEAIWGFATDTGERMGVDPTGAAMGALVACASVISDDWFIQPKRWDYSWVENARLRAVILGDPSVLKTPVLNACTKPIERLDHAERERYQQAMRAYKKALADWKKSPENQDEPRRPLLARYIIEGTTIEALSEALRDDDEATQCAPAKKILSKQDEMSEFFANLDRYRAGGKGGGDRGAWIRLYNGGRHTIDRIIRGVFAIPNWSACFLGGCQPGSIQRIAKDADEDGMLQRFMFAVPGPQQLGCDRTPNRPAIERYEGLFPALVALLPRRNDNGFPCHVVLHADAHQHREYVDSLAAAMAAMPDTSKRLIASYGKWQGMFARLCLTFHMIDVADCRARSVMPPSIEVIPEETARRVARFIQDVVLPHLLRADALMYRTTQTSHARWIAGFILAHRLERITSRDIARAYGALRPPECRKEMSEVMASLVLVGWLEPEDPSNALKPVSSWLVNPAVHTMFAEKAAAERAARQQTKDAIAETIKARRQKSGI